MASPYSDDLRRKLLNAHRRGEGSLSQLAKRFDVSCGWARKISAALRSTGKMERPPGGPRGPSSKVTDAVRQDLWNWIGKQADLTLAELQVRLYEQRDLEISVSRLWQVLGQMGLRLKKSHSTPPSKTRLAANRGAVPGAKQRTGSIRRS
jgi:transposase